MMYLRTLQKMPVAHNFKVDDFKAIDCCLTKIWKSLKIFYSNNKGLPRPTLMNNCTYMLLEYFSTCKHILGH